MLANIDIILLWSMEWTIACYAEVKTKLTWPIRNKELEVNVSITALKEQRHLPSIVFDTMLQ